MPIEVSVTSVIVKPYDRANTSIDHSQVSNHNPQVGITQSLQYISKPFSNFKTIHQLLAYIPKRL